MLLDQMFCYKVSKKRRRRKKKHQNRHTAKTGAKSRGAEDVRRRESTVAAAEKVEEAMQHLANPFDEMSIDQKKDLALFLCKRRLQVCDIQIFQIFQNIIELTSFSKVMNTINPIRRQSILGKAYSKARQRSMKMLPVR